MIKLTVLLVAALYAMLAIWGRPDGEVAAVLNEVATDRAVASAIPDFPQPVIVGRDAVIRTPQVTRAAMMPTPVPSSTEIAAETVADAAEVGRLGEPFTVSLLRADAATDRNAVVSGLLRVSGNRVNMRAGPSTADGILASLPEGALAEPLGPVSGGWQEIRVVETGQAGFMSARFLDPL